MIIEARLADGHFANSFPFPYLAVLAHKPCIQSDFASSEFEVMIEERLV